METYGNEWKPMEYDAWLAYLKWKWKMMEINKNIFIFHLIKV